jgi:quinol monooxygenase YgiN
MFTRVVEIRCKTGKANELSKLANEKAIPILRQQQGFQDEIVLTSSTDPNRVVALSFWNRREDAEHYHREQYPKIAEMLRPLCESEPTVSTYEVNTSTAHHISLGKAA